MGGGIGEGVGAKAGSKMLEVRNTVILTHAKKMDRENPYGVCNAKPTKEQAGECQGKRFDELLLRALKTGLPSATIFSVHDKYNMIQKMYQRY